jgi:large conductance mechanosensitive channel
MWKIFQEFKTFALQGNAFDLAVGVVIGAAFGKIVTSLVGDVIMPPLGLVMGGVDFSDKKIILKHAVLAGGKIITPEVAIMYGRFINNILDLLIVAGTIFLVIKAINLSRKKPPPPAPNSQKCPMCLSDIPIGARKCKFCASDLEPAKSAA